MEPLFDDFTAKDDSAGRIHRAALFERDKPGANT